MSPKMFQGTPEPEEETPLLRNGNTPRAKTPLPISQIVILLLLQLCEPITSHSIKPYINQLVSELPVVDGDEKKVGYYAGLIVSLYFAAEAVTILQWSRLSDKVGRKPVLLFGLLGTVVSSILFGLSRSFSALVFRPFIGGVLSRPQDRWPTIFSHPFWGEYPYFLPCLATAAYVLLSFILAAIFLKETVNSDSVMKPNTKVNSDLSPVGDGEILDGPVEDIEKPVPLRALLTRPVMVTVANYCMIALFDMAAGALIPLVWSTSVEFGGLSMSPASIGLWMAVYGSINCVIQFVAFPPLVGRFGPQRVFIASIILFFPVYILLPFENLVLRRSSRGLNLAAGLLITLQIVTMSFSDMGFSAIFMYISSASPNKRSLGATNGLAQTMVSIQRTVGPAAATSLFAVSLDNNILGGNFAYVVLLCLVWVGLAVAVQLPRGLWEHDRSMKKGRSGLMRTDSES
ncbi:MFS general substrate transporter [Lactarius sanguifluus]|nr:MFS general substrate transporter [Lactarius sanguifluus]